MRFLLAILFLLSSVNLCSQNDPETEKAIKTFNDGKLDKGIALMQKVVNRTNSGDDWDILVKMYSERYSFAKQNEIDQLVAVLMSSMGGKKKKVKAYTRSAICLDDLLNKCLEAGLNSQSEYASMYLRIFLVDHPTDTAVSKEAEELFKEAEKFFGKKDYKKAKNKYLQALAKQPGYYKALIYAGDCYWYLEDLDSAIYCFRQGISIHSDLLEPRKYLVDALADKKKNVEAYNESVNAIFIYPDVGMFIKMSAALKRENKKFDRHWMRRGAPVNEIGRKKIISSNNSTWLVYQGAMDKLKPYCDSNGIVNKPNSLTTSNYLEVYSWEEMLAKAPDSEDFEFARRMKKEGFLDCFVFISAFHHSTFEQYQHFVSANKDRIRTYIEKYLTR